MKTANLKNFIGEYATTIQIGLLTGGAIILFQVISLFVTYRYLRLDYYLCLVAGCFLVTGLLLNKRPAQAETTLLQERPSQNLLVLLTSKELLILRLLAEGKTNKEIAAVQFVELSTIKTHVNNIYTKLSVSNRKEARSKYAEMTRKFPIS